MPWEQGYFVLLRWSLSQIKQPQLPKNRDFPGSSSSDKILTVLWGCCFSMSSTRGQSLSVAERLLAFCGYHPPELGRGRGWKEYPIHKIPLIPFSKHSPVVSLQIDDFQVALWLWLVSQVLKRLMLVVLLLFFTVFFCGRVCSLRSSLCHSGSWSPGKLIPKTWSILTYPPLSAESLLRARPASISSESVVI